MPPYPGLLALNVLFSRFFFHKPLHASISGLGLHASPSRKPGFTYGHHPAAIILLASLDLEFSSAGPDNRLSPAGTGLKGRVQELKAVRAADSRI